MNEPHLKTATQVTDTRVYHAEKESVHSKETLMQKSRRTPYRRQTPSLVSEIQCKGEDKVYRVINSLEEERKAGVSRIVLQSPEWTYIPHKSPIGLPLSFIWTG
jgi:hypothetical protein